jgi:hypothetical protein
VQIAPVVFDLYEIFTNLLATEQQKKWFVESYGEEEFNRNYSDSLFKLVSILKSFSMLITYQQSSNKDKFLNSRAYEIINDILI